MITKKLNPDATIADAGKPMEAYYDEKAKRWIFPGDDPAEVAKPLAPPPITPGVKKSDKAATPAATPNDPLSSLMAPPSRSTPSADPLANLMAPPTRSTPMRDLSGPPRMPRSSVSSNTPNTAKKLPGTTPAPSTDAPPQFVIFTPKTSTEFCL